METKDILNTFLAELLDGVKKAGAFVSEQLPLVLQEYIAWGIAVNAMWAVLCIGLVVFGWKVWFKWAWPRLNDSEICDPTGEVLATVFVIAPAFFGGAFGATHHLSMMVKAIVAPRVYLIEQLSDLLK